MVVYFIERTVTAMSNTVIITSECERCIYGDLDETNKAKIIIHCDYKDKNYIYGACIPCDDFKRRKGTDGEV